MIRFLFFFILVSPIITIAQVTGRVVNENNEPLPFASVAVKGTPTAVSTDSAGHFSIERSKYPFTLVVTFVGYDKKEKVIRSVADDAVLIQLQSLFQRDTVIVTSRRRREVLQDVPIPISVVSGTQVDEAGAFNVNRIKELVPSVQLYSSNPRNTGLNIRGLGSPFGLTNDGIDPGVGYYVDGVYYARPAATTLDFVDIERIEVLRGPQGTLFGKNTTSGAFNITTKRPTFVPGANFETSFGNFGYVQAKASVTGALSKKFAARLSASGTQRDGLLYNVRTLKHLNDINNQGFHGQLLYKPSINTSILLSADNTRQRPDGYAQVYAGTIVTKRAAYRQFNVIIGDLHYSLPSQNPFDRLVDHDTPWNSDNDLGGVSINLDSKIGAGTLTATSAWRYWKWSPSSDRDFTGLQSLAKSASYSKQHQLSQEVRYAGDFSSHLSGVAGVYILGQEVASDPYAIEEAGSATWRFQQNSTSPLWSTPGLFEGFGTRTLSSIKSFSAAVFANLDWEIVKGLHILPGLRYNYDKKDVIYDRQVYGGLDTAKFNGTTAQKTTLQGFKNGVYSNQSYVANANENHVTYQVTIAYRPSSVINAYATYATAFKPIGVNVAGLPTTSAGKADVSLAVIKPEDVRNIEVGIKTTPIHDFNFNLSFFNTDIKNYQTNVQSPEIGVNRGYLANAEKVRVRGVEADANIIVSTHFSFYGAASYTDAKYVRFTNAPLPLEETGLTVNGSSVSFKDISGGVLPGISKWAGSLGGEYSVPAPFFGKPSKFFVAVESFFRSRFSSSPTPSAYLNIDGYTLLNGRIGFKATKGLSAFVWGRNLFNKDYFEQLLVAGGNAGQYAGVLGDQRTYGITLRYGL